MNEFPTIVSITRDMPDLKTLVAQVTGITTGGVAIFTGIVRGKTEGEQPVETLHLEYEAYDGMAEKMLLQIAGEIRQKWPKVEGIALVQRIGTINPGELAVVVACSAAHRDEGIFEAARYGIDRLKEIVPVWKKEVGPQGEEWVG
jgi:molybdopterin synthase catalytic subunit